jgi:hypothetical protein
MIHPRDWFPEKECLSGEENERNANTQSPKKCGQKQNGESKHKMSDEKVFYAGYPFSTERQKGMSPNMNRGLAGLRCIENFEYTK